MSLSYIFSIFILSHFIFLHFTLKSQFIVILKLKHNKLHTTMHRPTIHKIQLQPIKLQDGASDDESFHFYGQGNFSKSKLLA
jgi:hypothetical protein